MQVFVDQGLHKSSRAFWGTILLGRESKEVLAGATGWINLENVLLRERSQTQEATQSLRLLIKTI